MCLTPKIVHTISVYTEENILLWGGEVEASDAEEESIHIPDYLELKLALERHSGEKVSVRILLPSGEENFLGDISLTHWFLLLLFRLKLKTFLYDL